MIRLGVLGMGAAAFPFVAELQTHPAFELVGCADPSVEAREQFNRDHGLPAFACLSEMLGQADLDAVYIATPTELHRAHALEALAAGKHVIIEKPYAVTVEDAYAMTRAAEAAGRVIVVGHSHSHDLPIRRMRDIIQSGRLGAVKMAHTWCYTDWVYRPRRPDEFRVDMGGGVTYRQGAHQFDILCSLCGDDVISVSGSTFDMDPARPTVGAHTAMLRFASGAVATAVYNGYGRFRSTDLTQRIEEWGFVAAADVAPRIPSAIGSVDELAQKKQRAGRAIRNDAPHQPHFGLTMVSCASGDIRQSPDGLLVYADGEFEEIRLASDTSPQRLVLDEFAAAVKGGTPLHDGWRGASVVEICAALHESSAQGSPVSLNPSGARSGYLK